MANTNLRLALFLCLALAGCSYRDLSSTRDGKRGSGRTPASPVASGGAAAQGGDDGGAGEGDPQAGSRRNVIIVIGDGMQLAHEVAASRYLYGEDRALSFHDFPVQSFVTTWDVNVYDVHAAGLGKPPYSPETFDPTIGYDPAIGGDAPYPVLADAPERRQYFVGGPFPDSASTATAMSTGIKTDSAKIAWSPGVTGRALETSAQKLRRLHGMAIGYVTTVPISHATPAGWFAHSIGRFDYLTIAREILFETRPEVVIGGVGSAYMDLADIAAAKASGVWSVAERTPGLEGNQVVLTAAREAIHAKKALLGLFGAADGNFEAPLPMDRPGDPILSRALQQDPELGGAASAALEVLAADPDGFFLLVEQGGIDWANHSADFSRMVGCVSDLDAGVRAIVDFVERPGDAVDWTNTTLIVTADHANGYLRLERLLERGDLPTQLGAGVGAYPDGDVSYGGLSHTNELVTLYVKGAASAFVETLPRPYPEFSIIDDTAIYELTMEAAKR